MFSVVFRCVKHSFVLQHHLWLDGNRVVSVARIPLRHQEGTHNYVTNMVHSDTLHLQRQEDERFKKIDAKRGGRGFV